MDVSVRSAYIRNWLIWADELFEPSWRVGGTAAGLSPADRKLLLQMEAVLTIKSFFVVNSVTIRNGAVRSALADARRCSPTFVAVRDACHGAR